MGTNYMSGITQCRQNCLYVANGQKPEGKNVSPVTLVIMTLSEK